MWRPARVAVAFLTLIPVGGFPFARREVRWASAWFPVVGAAVGAGLAALWWACRWLPPFPAALIVVTAGWMVTGALHEDGLADTADALLGGHNRERMFAILKDPRVGTYGAVALISSVGLRAALIAESAPQTMIALVTAHAVSRTAPVVLLATLPYCTDPATSRSRGVTDGGWPQAAVALGWLAALAAVLLTQRWATPVQVGMVVAGTVVVTVGLGVTFRRRAGGVTGDFLGTTQQVVETLVLGVFVARVP